MSRSRQGHVGHALDPETGDGGLEGELSHDLEREKRFVVADWPSWM